MPVPSESSIRRVLRVRDRDLLIRTAIENAWNTVAEEYPATAWFRRGATRAGLIWEHTIQNVIEAFDSDKGAQIYPHNDTMSFTFAESVLIRFKKADMRLHTRSYPTQTALMFHEHHEDLFGFEGVQRVEAVYVLNSFRTRIDWIGIVARHNGDVLWHFELGGGTDNIVDLPRAPVAVGPALEKVLKPKTDDKRGNEKSEDE